MSKEHTGNKYIRQILPRAVQNGKFYVDVYNVIDAFGVTCPATAHAIKKLLCAGLRGKGDRLKDLTETVDAVQRAIELEMQHKEEEKGKPKPSMQVLIDALRAGQAKKEEKKEEGRDVQEALHGIIGPKPQ